MKLFNNVAVACDHAAYDEKQKLIAHLREEGYQVKDCGCDSSESCHYPIFAHRLCTSIQQGESEIGILICGTGIGMSIAANKHKGIRAACCSDTFSARLTREHNDANILCFGERVVGAGLALELVDAFLDAEYLNNGNHVTRVAMLTEIENNN